MKFKFSKKQIISVKGLNFFNKQYLMQHWGNQLLHFEDSYVIAKEIGQKYRPVNKISF